MKWSRDPVSAVTQGAKGEARRTKPQVACNRVFSAAAKFIGSVAAGLHPLQMASEYRHEPVCLKDQQWLQ
jgi:hypothetical protein